MMTKETRRLRFLRVGQALVKKVLEALDKLKKCSERKNYDYSEAEVDKMLSAIENELKSVREAFKGREAVDFSFDS